MTPTQSTLVARMRLNESEGARIVDYQAFGVEVHPAVKALPDDQRLWSPHLDEAFTDGDIETLLEAGEIRHHLDGWPFFTTEPAP